MNSALGDLHRVRTLPDPFLDSRHLPYPQFKPMLFDKMKSLCR